MAEENILIVDDEEIIRVSLQRDLLDEGYVVDIAKDGKTAIGMLDKKYDLIITDLMMEGIGGVVVPLILPESLQIKICTFLSNCSFHLPLSSPLASSCK